MNGADERARPPGVPNVEGAFVEYRRGGWVRASRIAELAQAHNLPVTMHDCTGPLTLFSGMHVAASVPAVTLQETVRAHIRSFYSELVDTLPVIERGQALLPQGPGLGTRLHNRLFDAGQPTFRRTEWRK